MRPITTSYATYIRAKRGARVATPPTITSTTTCELVPDLLSIIATYATPLVTIHLLESHSTSLYNPKSLLWRQKVLVETRGTCLDDDLDAVDWRYYYYVNATHYGNLYVNIVPPGGGAVELTPRLVTTGVSSMACLSDCTEFDNIFVAKGCDILCYRSKISVRKGIQTVYEQATSQCPTPYRVLCYPRRIRKMWCPYGLNIIVGTPYVLLEDGTLWKDHAIVANGVVFIINIGNTKYGEFGYATRDRRIGDLLSPDVIDTDHYYIYPPVGWCHDDHRSLVITNRGKLLISGENRSILEVCLPNPVISLTYRMIFSGDGSTYKWYQSGSRILVKRIDIDDRIIPMGEDTYGYNVTQSGKLVYYRTINYEMTELDVFTDVHFGVHIPRAWNICITNYCLYVLTDPSHE